MVKIILKNFTIPYMSSITHISSSSSSSSSSFFFSFGVLQLMLPEAP
jgi:hypothetical protein